MSRKFLASLALLAGLLPVAVQAADVGVSIQISEPGVYGRIDIGRFPQPQVIVAQPVIVQQPRVVVARPQPVYMWVPPGHQKNWRKHCRSYSACGVPVYFVQDGWYQQNVKGDRDGHPGKGRGKGPDDDDRGKGRGHGNGNGKHKDKD